MTPDLFGNYVEQIHFYTTHKLSKVIGGSNLLKVIS